MQADLHCKIAKQRQSAESDNFIDNKNGAD